MPRTKTKARPTPRRTYSDDFTPMSYQDCTPTAIREELNGWIDNPGSVMLFVALCELLKPQRIERITYDHDARAVLAFAAFTGPKAGQGGEWEEIYKRINDYLEVCRTDEKRIHPMVSELRNLIIGWKGNERLRAAGKAEREGAQ